MKKLTHTFLRINQIFNIVYAVVFLIGAVIFALTLGPMQEAVNSGQYYDEVDESIAEALVIGVLWIGCIVGFFIAFAIYMVGFFISNSALKKLETATRKRELIPYGILLLIFGAFPPAGVMLFVIPDRILSNNQ